MHTKILLTITLIIWLCGIHGGAQTNGEGEIKLLRTGQFHGNEVTHNSGETWYGLFPIGDGFELKALQVAIETVPDPLSGNENDTTGKKVAVDIEGSPLFLVQGLPNPVEGEVETTFTGTRFIYPAESIGFKLGHDKYFRISALGEAVEHYGDFKIINYKIILSTATTSQIVAQFQRVYGEGSPQLLWVGDLDRDNKIDLLLDLRNHYNVEEYALFLSSRAEKGKLVKECARFRIVGC